MSVVHVFLGRPRDLLPSILPSISCICDVLCLIRCPRYCRMVISTGVGEASSVGAGRCAYRICFQPSPLTSLTAKSERSTSLICQYRLPAVTS